MRADSQLESKASTEEALSKLSVQFSTTTEERAPNQQKKLSRKDTDTKQKHADKKHKNAKTKQKDDDTKHKMKDDKHKDPHSKRTDSATKRKDVDVEHRVTKTKQKHREYKREEAETEQRDMEGTADARCVYITVIIVYKSIERNCLLTNAIKF